MNQDHDHLAQQIAEAASALQLECTGHAPTSVTVVLSEDTLVVTLHEALTPAERALAQSPAGAAQVQEFHRQLFANSTDSMRQEIKRITVRMSRSLWSRGGHGHGTRHERAMAGVPAGRTYRSRQSADES
jgi:uncharacterized protein YbcI